jgi:hypothetical protein
MQLHGSVCKHFAVMETCLTPYASITFPCMQALRRGVPLHHGSLGHAWKLALPRWKLA